MDQPRSQGFSLENWEGREEALARRSWSSSDFPKPFGERQLISSRPFGIYSGTPLYGHTLNTDTPYIADSFL